jgi:phosphopentomutase
MLFGHRRDPLGYACALQEFDGDLARLLELLRHDDVVMLTADHGNDPTFAGTTDHTREYVPWLVLGDGIRAGADLGTRDTFADIGATVEDLFELRPSPPGSSALPRLRS